ncbi:FAS1-like dehydratase domain-containing protein [Jiangella mangrovi]|uniref:Acyl dehydratase n=1 Tax=Jiangella mangrovi TaxID=1524084 RepID=A0A7W9GWD0_9ACTN|nr:acyl dehydratase [Jiangella mangrovi]
MTSHLKSPLKSPSWEAVEVGEELGPAVVAVDEHAIRAFAFTQDDHHPWYLDDSPFGGPVAPPGLLANELLLVYYHQYRQEECRQIHTHERLDFHHPVRPGDTVTIRGRYVDKYERRGKGYVVIEAEARGADGTLLVSHRGVEILSARPGEFVRPGEGPAAPATATLSRRKVPHADQVVLFSNAGKFQRNIHTDLDKVRDAGLDAPLVQGLQQACYLLELGVERFGAAWFTAGRLDVRFVAPLAVGEPVWAEADGDDCWVRDGAGRLTTVGTLGVSAARTSP